jgi:hypothetical protein
MAVTINFETRFKLLRESPMWWQNYVNSFTIDAWLKSPRDIREKIKKDLDETWGATVSFSNPSEFGGVHEITFEDDAHATAFILTWS